MNLVVDASVAVKWVVKEEGHAAALALLGEHDLSAPDLLLAESANILWKKLRLGQLDEGQAKTALEFIQETFPRLAPSSSLAKRELELAAELAHPAYDCFYLAHAESLNAKLVTADKRLTRRLLASSYRDRLHQPAGLLGDQ